jgi:hypothetical protein
MQTHASDVADPEGNLSPRLARGSRVQKMQFTVDSTFDDSDGVQCRVAFCEELLQVMRHAKEANFEYLSTGDES